MSLRNSANGPPGRSVRTLSGTVCLLLALQCVTTGCAGMRSFAFRQEPGPFGPKTPCCLSKTPSAAEVVAHLNENVDRIDGWRASSVRIRAQSVPIPLSGNLVVERDQRMRLEVTSVAGKEVDLGSNDELFWLWMRPRGQQPPAVYFASHDDMDVARQNLPLPFEPTWLMEALGVAPLSAENVQIDGEPGIAAIKLVSHHDMPDGQRVKKVVTVHACHGYVMEHSIYDERGQPVVRALMQDYRRDVGSGAVLPRHIKLDWPQAEMSLAMDLGHVEINPPVIPAAVWTMPQVPGSALVDLGDPRLNGGKQYASRPRRDAPPTTRNGATAQSGGTSSPAMLATSAPDVDPFLAPVRPPVSTASRAADFPEDDFSPPQIRWQEMEGAEFGPPLGEEPAGRAAVDLLPAIEPF